jgi:hypothetical protein
MSKRASVRFNHLSFVPAAVNRLLFAVLPASPDQPSSLVTGKPTIPRRSLWRQRHSHDPVVQIFLCMMIDRCAEGLKIGAGTASLTAGMSVRTALGGGDLGQHPEDCGGIPGYYEFLENIDSKQINERKAALDWYGGLYDQDEIGTRRITATLSRVANAGRRSR